MTGATRPTLAETFRRAALPLGSYYTITLALPMANGAAQSGSGFVHHAVVVIVVPLLLIALAYMVLKVRSAGLQACRARRRSIVVIDPAHTACTSQLGCRGMLQDE